MPQHFVIGESIVRLSIEVTPEQHQQLKTVAALRGQSIKAYVLERVLPQASADDDDAMRQLDAFLELRLQESNAEPINKSVLQIFEEVRLTMPSSNAAV
jgi:hypothetical protein